MTDKTLLKAAEAASMLSIGRSTFFRYVSTGILPQPIKIGGLIRWRVEDLRAVGQATQPTTSSTRAAGADTEPGCTMPAQRQALYAPTASQ